MEIKLMTILLIEVTVAIISHEALANGLLSRPNSQEAASSNNHRNTNAVKSIRSEDGDIIDCIDIHKQPAFNHPALKNHKIQMKPSYVPTKDITSYKANTAKTPKQRKGEVPIALATQLWHRSGSCPEGTVPIRRMQKKSPYEARKPSFFQHSKKFNISTPSKLLLANHSLTVLHSEGFAYLGAKGDIYVWNPRVELDDEFSTSQVALKSGSHNNFEAVEAGWAVNPGLYKDRQTRFFVYWTNDSSRETGCFDQFCPGFVQVNKEIALGAALLPNSTRGQLAVPIIVYIFKDLKSNNWWINYGEKTNVGYWPAELFTSLNHYAETVQWGGEVYSANLETLGTRPHTATQMGSGEYGYPHYDVGVIKRIRVLENSLALQYPQFTASFSDEYDCYSYQLFKGRLDPEFYYGGPGRNWKCP
ncbi:protein neprosin [Coffea arabica]|uniref:Protein neprosin n=1 Tax=Coffea arabica TaxID=13443 RepID=A0A6P6U191_COFAR|nr:uncharacterized protein LOC113706144 [Coffea arabica]